MTTRMLTICNACHRELETGEAYTFVMFSPAGPGGVADIPASGHYCGERTCVDELMSIVRTGSRTLEIRMRAETVYG